MSLVGVADSSPPLAPVNRPLCAARDAQGALQGRPHFHTHDERLYVQCQGPLHLGDVVRCARQGVSFGATYFQPVAARQVIRCLVVLTFRLRFAPSWLFPASVISPTPARTTATCSTSSTVRASTRFRATSRPPRTRFARSSPRLTARYVAILIHVARRVEPCERCGLVRIV